MLSGAPGGRLLTSSRYSSPSSFPASITVAQISGRSIFEVKSGPSLPRTSVSSPSQRSAFLKYGRQSSHDHPRFPTWAQPPHSPARPPLYISPPIAHHPPPT